MKSNMFKSLVAALAVTGMFVAITTARAAATDSQTVTFTIASINELAVSGDPLSTLTVTAPTAGAAPTDATPDDSTTYAITSNETNRKITAGIGADMPAGVTLTVSLAAPAGALSQGDKPLALTGGAVDVVTGISNVNQSGLMITYKLSATAAAAPITADTRLVTFTIVAGE